MYSHDHNGNKMNYMFNRDVSKVLLDVSPCHLDMRCQAGAWADSPMYSMDPSAKELRPERTIEQ